MSPAMTIHLDQAAAIGGTRLDAGTYQVALDEAAATLRLTRGTAAHELPVRRRSSKMRVRRPSVQLRAVEGEPRWLIVVRTPPAEEWVASLDRVP